MLPGPNANAQSSATNGRKGDDGSSGSSSGGGQMMQKLNEDHDRKGQIMMAMQPDSISLVYITKYTIPIQKNQKKITKWCKTNDCNRNRSRQRSRLEWSEEFQY